MLYIVSNYSIRLLTFLFAPQSIQKLAWASKLKVVTIFRTEVQHLQAGLTDCNSPIPKLLNCEQCETAYPFDALADPDGRAAESFDCNTSSIFKTLKMNRKSAPKMCKRLLTSSMVRKEALFAARHGAGNLLPSEFLIDGRGKVVDIMRATKSNEHMTSERISNFLLEGEMKKILSSSTSLPVEDAESVRKRIMERRGSAFL